MRGLGWSVVLLLAILVGRADAIEMNAVFPELGLPGFKITPFLTQRGEYQTNVLQARRSAIDDFISKTIPGIVVELPLGRHRLDLAARAELLHYLDNTQFDNTHFFLLGSIRLDFPGGLLIRVRDDLAQTSDPPGTELTGRVDSFTNILSPDVEYRLVDRFSIGANYSWTHVNFEQSVQSLDRDEHLAGVSLFWRVASKTDLLANYAYGIKTFDADRTRDVTRHIGVVGIRGELTSKLTSTFRIGWESRIPDQAGFTRYDGLVASGDWTFTPTNRTRFTLLTQRSPEESVFATNRFFVASLATLLVQQRFGPKLTFNARLFGGLNEYPDKASDETSAGQFRHRRDWLLGTGAGIDYQIQRWLAVGLDYSLSRRDSNFDTFDYIDHIVGLKVTLSL